MNFFRAALCLLFFGCAGAASQSSASDTAQAWSNHTWMLAADGDQVRLGFAVPETDDEPIALTCRSGSGLVQVTAIDPRRSGATLSLASAGRTATYAAEPISNPDIDDGVYSRALVATTDPVLVSFGQSMHFAVGEPSIALPVRTDAERLAIEAFFENCDDTSRSAN